MEWFIWFHIHFIQIMMAIFLLRYKVTLLSLFLYLTGFLCCFRMKGISCWISSLIPSIYSFSVFTVAKCHKRWFKFFHGFILGSISVLIILSLLHVHSPSSLGGEQILKTAEAIVSNLPIYRKKAISWNEIILLLLKWRLKVAS